MILAQHFRCAVAHENFPFLFNGNQFRCVCVRVCDVDASTRTSKFAKTNLACFGPIFLLFLVLEAFSR